MSLLLLFDDDDDVATVPRGFRGAGAPVRGPSGTGTRSGLHGTGTLDHPLGGDGDSRRQGGTGSLRRVGKGTGGTVLALLLALGLLVRLLG